jgi:DNA-binding XRE family transcriptional regulator
MANPETPFRALRYQLGFPIDKWAMSVDSTVSTLSHSERGRVIPLVPLAKRMIEEARIRGIAVTLDELYQHVLPYGYILDENGMMVKEDDDKKEYRAL